jgi:hypothetical protein
VKRFDNCGVSPYKHFKSDNRNDVVFGHDSTHILFRAARFVVISKGDGT